MSTFSELLSAALAEETVASVDVHVQADVDNSVGKCLISKQPLDYSRVALKCGHAFNYEDLFQHLVFCKQLRHAKNTIVCPYCRVVTPNVLPRCQRPSGSMVPSRTGINAPTSLALPEYRCTWVGGQHGAQCACPGVLHPRGVHCKKHIDAFLRLEAKKAKADQKAKQKAEQKQAQQAKLAKQKEAQREKERKRNEKRCSKLVIASNALEKNYMSLREKFDALDETRDERCVEADERRVESLLKMCDRLNVRMEALNVEWAAFNASLLAASSSSSSSLPFLPGAFGLAASGAPAPPISVE